MKTFITIVLAFGFVAALGVNYVQWEQVQKLNATVSSQTTELAQAKKTINTLESQLQSIRPDVLTAKNPPIELKARKAFSGNGLVLIFINTANKPITLNVRCTSANFITSKQFKLDIAAGQLAEIGSEQGWGSGRGDKIKVTCTGYDDTTFTVP